MFCYFFCEAVSCNYLVEIPTIDFELLRVSSGCQTIEFFLKVVIICCNKKLCFSGYKFKKPSIIELVLYNMAALLGGVAAGYDVRVSNVSPLHPTLQPHR